MCLWSFSSKYPTDKLLYNLKNAYFVWKQKHFRLTAEGLEHMAAFIGRGPPMRPFDRHVKQPITVHFVQRHVSGRGNVTTITKLVCETLGCNLKKLYRKLYIFHILLKIQPLVDSDKRLPHICKHDGFLLSWGGLASRPLCFQEKH